MKSKFIKAKCIHNEFINKTCFLTTNVFKIIKKMPKVTDYDEIYQCQICLEMYDETKRKPMMFNKCI
jgi:hypothetical protein